MHDFRGYFSRTFQDLKLQFPGLSRTKVIFLDFPGPGIFKKKSRTFQEAWEPGKSENRSPNYATIDALVIFRDNNDLPPLQLRDRR